LHERFPVAVRAVFRRRMPLTRWDGLLWSIGEPQAWGQPASMLPVIVENDFILAAEPVYFRSNIELSGEGYYLTPAPEAGPKEPFVVVVEESGLELWLTAKDVAGGALQPLLDRVERFCVETLHDWALLNGVAVRRPAWEITIADPFPREHWIGLAVRTAAAWKDVDRDPEKLAAAARYPTELAQHVSARGVLATR
jgi:hypothetical protein